MYLERNFRKGYNILRLMFRLQLIRKYESGWITSLTCIEFKQTYSNLNTKMKYTEFDKNSPIIIVHTEKHTSYSTG